MSARVLAESALRVSDCVTELLRKQPFFGSLILRLPLRADATRETLATDGYEIRYSPRWVAETASHLIETAMARVVMACALKHHTRRGDRDPERWQRASQLVTHALIRDAGFTLPPGAEAWEDLSVEQAYERLSERADDEAGDDASASPDAGSAGADAAEAGQSSSEADDDDTADPSDSADDEDRHDEDGDGDDADGQGEDRDGKSRDADGQDGHGRGQDADDQAEDSASDAPPSHDPSGTGEVMDADARAGDDGEPAEAPLDVTAEEQAWDEAMHQALNIARAEGKVPGQVEETIRSAHASTLDWRTLLRRFMTDTAKRDYTWSQPNRRFIDSGLYLPAMHCEAMGTIVVLLDASGSIYSHLELLAIFWTEVREVAHELNPARVIVVQVDTRITDIAEYAGEDLPEELEAKGGGGTDFRPGFAWLDAEGIEPACCLYFTDMECSDYPDAEPGFPVLWCDYGDGDSPWRHPAPWGEHIRLDG